MGLKFRKALVIKLKTHQSSNLAIPVSPFSPQPPLTPPPLPISKTSPSAEHINAIHKLQCPPPPQQPLPWLWQCHVCNRCYQLGVTRRCLEDGHYFCSGTTVVKGGARKAGKKTIRHKACQSEFDYQGWKVWGNWRRAVIEQASTAVKLDRMLAGDGLVIFAPDGPDEDGWLSGRWARSFGGSAKVKCEKRQDCWNTCDYPSECRWGAQFGVRTPSPEPVVALVMPSPLQMQPGGTSAGRDGGSPMDFEATQTAPEVILEGAACAPSSLQECDIQTLLVDEQLESANDHQRESTFMDLGALSTNESRIANLEPPSSTAQVLQKTLDDLELDLRKSFGSIVSSFVGTRRGSMSSGGKKSESLTRGNDRRRKKSTASLN